MPSLERDAIERSLLKKGFVDDGGDHRYFRLLVDGKYTGICTKTSRGSKYKTLSNDLVAAMAKQLHLTTKQFVSLVDCTLSAEEYQRLLDEAGEL